METETIDKLFLELSQVTRATTAKEMIANSRSAEAARLHEEARMEAVLLRAEIAASARARRVGEAVLPIAERYDYETWGAVAAALQADGHAKAAKLVIAAATALRGEP